MVCLQGLGCWCCPSTKPLRAMRRAQVALQEALGPQNPLQKHLLSSYHRPDEAQRICVTHPGPHGGLDLESAELRRP